MENKAHFVQLEQNLVADLDVLSANQELSQPHGIPATDADLIKAFILKWDAAEIMQKIGTLVKQC